MTEYLIIDFGDHVFESISALKYCKEQLLLIESVLLQFTKVGFIHPSGYSNQSDNPRKLQYFSDHTTAEQWLRE